MKIVNLDTIKNTFCIYFTGNFLIWELRMGENIRNDIYLLNYLGQGN